MRVLSSTSTPARGGPTVALVPTRLLVLATAAGAALAVPAAAGAAGLPVVALTTERAIRDDPKTAGRLRLTDGATVAYDGRMAVEVRGQSSQRFPKKSYDVELRRIDGTDRKAALLGMPADGDWVLHAAYNDKTLMRNALAYATARRMGRYAPATRFVELRLNGRYRGVYVLTEEPELGGDRADGEHLLELTFPYQARRKGDFFTTPRGRPIVQADTKAPQDRARVRSAVRTAERRLYGRRWRSPRLGWRRSFDAAAMTDHVLLQELLKNEDAFHASTFMTTTAGGPIVMGPAWDFDLSTGNTNYGPSARLAGSMVARRDWAERLLRDGAFVRGLARRWRELRAGGLLEAMLAQVDANVRTLGPAIGRNFRRWPVLGRYVWPNPRDPRTGRFRPTYRSEVAHLRSWLTRRAAWLDRNVDRLGRR
jgi:hypothetical protein